MVYDDAIVMMESGGPMVVSIRCNAEGDFHEYSDIHFRFDNKEITLSEMDLNTLDVTERLLREHMFMVDYNTVYQESLAHFNSRMSIGMFVGLVILFVAHWLISDYDASAELYSFLITSCAVLGVLSLWRHWQLKKVRSVNQALSRELKKVENHKQAIINDLNG